MAHTLNNEVSGSNSFKPTIQNSFPKISALELNRLLDDGAALITSNQRLSRFRLQKYEESQIEQEKKTWPTPNIIPWSVWLQQQWQTSGEGVSLSQQQESLLWRTCIAEDELTQVLNPKALSKQAMDAWKMLADYQIDPSCLQYAGEEHTALWRWGNAVIKKTEHSFQYQILELLSENRVQTVPACIILDGFDTLAPAQLHYLKHLQTSGSKVHELVTDYPAAHTSVTVYPDEETELRHVCHRIRECLVHKPDAKIGVLIPNLEQRPGEISRIFSEELAPELSLKLNSDLQGDSFNLSLGSVLAKQPMIQSLFSIFSLSVKQSIQHHEFTALLLNPYITGYAAEMQLRAAIDKEFRKSNQYTLTIDQFISFCEQLTIKAPAFLQFIENISTYKKSNAFAGKQLISNWLVLAEKILTHLEWHEQASNPNELAQVQNWRDLIDQLTGLDDYCGSIGWGESLSRLQEFAHEQLFRPAPGQANIQVMGLLEAANLRFDYAFVLGIDNISWPPAAKPHPLIPFDIQVLHQTPHANSEREWLYAQTVWENIQRVSPTLDISYAKSKGNQDVQASPLLLEASEIKEAENHQSHRYTLSLQQQPASTQIIRENRLRVPSSEEVRGGTGLLKSQAACAFQAFAQHRLHLNGLETPSLGLNAAEQGTLLHAALETFWKKVESNKKLLDLIAKELLRVEINACIESSWVSLNRLIPAETKVLEGRRLYRLIEQWLSYESEREPFEVKEFEVWRNLRVGIKKELTLHTKIDRIDSDGEGHHIIIDYKTGEATVSKALGQQLSEPQLPAYFLAEKALNKDIDALAFAQVRNGSLSFKGFAQEANILPKIRAFKGKKGEPEDWDELTSQWQEVLDGLADEFMSGEADVSPKNSQSCTYCDFAGLCRISGS